MPRPGTLENRVLDILWQGGERTVREVLDEVGESLAYTTIATVLDRLHDKGRVVRTKVGNSWRYSAARTREAAVAHQVSRLLQQTGASPEPALLAFLDHAEAVDPEVLDRLEALILGSPGGSVSALSLPLVVLAAFLGTAWLAAAVWFPLWGALARRSVTLARASILAAALPTALALVLVTAMVLPVDPHAGLAMGCHCEASSLGWMHLCPLHPAAAAPLVGPALVVVLLLAPGRLRRLQQVVRATNPFEIQPSSGPSGEPLILSLPQRTALVAGVLRPRVVVDRQLWEALSPTERAVVVAHEQGHLDRRDPLILAVLGVLCAVGPWFTGDGVVRAWLRRAELAADRAAAAATDPVWVAEVLLRCARLQQGAALALSWGGGGLEQRVRRLLWPSGGPRLGRRDFEGADGLVLVVVLMAAIAAGGGLHHPLEHLLNLGR